MLIDSHCHLQHFEGEERRAVVDRARERGVTEFVVPAVRLDEAEDLLAFCDAEPGVWCALGVHPHDAESWREGDEVRLRELLGHPKVVAVGECGLDFFYDHAPRDVQERVFRAQIDLALELDLPVVVHNRESNEAMMDVLENPAYRGLKVDLHSFAGGLPMARRAIPLGCWFGVSGMVTFPESRQRPRGPGRDPPQPPPGRDRHALPGAGPVPRQAQRAGLRRRGRRPPRHRARPRAHRPRRPDHGELPQAVRQDDGFPAVIQTGLGTSRKTCLRPKREARCSPRARTPRRSVA